jgi:RNA polymerase sigma factor
VAAAAELVAAAQAGDSQARERVLEQFRGLVLRVGARVCGRYLRVGRDDEVSVGLLALNEAIDRYRGDVGASFPAFAEIVVRRRLIDQYRRETGRREVPRSALERDEEDGGRWEAAEWQEAQEIDRARREAEERRAEIAEFAALLRPYGVTLRDLVAQSPQHADARLRAVAVARRLAANPEWVEHLRRKRALPLRELQAVPDLGVSRKTLERQRKFIIAVAVILMEGLPALRGYLPEAE